MSKIVNKWNGSISLTPKISDDLLGSLKSCMIMQTATDIGDVTKMIEKLCQDSVKLNKLAKYVIETGRVSTVE